MAGRHTDLVKPDSFVPGLREREPDAPTQQLARIEQEQQGGLSPEEILAEPPDARDIAAELAAPPRRKLPWLTLVLAGGVIAALGFTGGALVEKNHAKSGSAANPFAALGRTGGAGATAGAGFGGGAGGFGGGGSAAGGPTTGTVKLVDGDTVYLTTSSGNVVKVTTGKSTKVSVTKNGKVADLQPGQSVTVQGSTDSSGDLAATTVTEGATSPLGGGGGFGG